MCWSRWGVEARTDQWLNDAISIISSSDQEHHHRTLVVITSDHGMTDAGSHGGTSHHEIETTLIFAHASPGMRWPDHVGSCHTKSARHVLQISLAPTLALIFGVPVPFNNVAPLIPDVFEHADAGEFAVASCMVAKQISNIVEQHGGPSCNLDKCRFLTAASVASFKKSCPVRDIVAQPWFVDLRGAPSDEVLASARQLCGEGGIAFVEAVRTSSNCSAIALNLHSSPSIVHLVASLSGAFVALLVAVVALLIPRRECIGVYSATVTAHCACMFTTTFMEEEHLIVYFLVSFLHSQALRSLVLDSSSSHRIIGLVSCILSWVCCFILRSFCSGGSKWAHLWDIRGVVLSSMLLQRFLSVASAFTFCATAHLNRCPRLVSATFSAAICISAAASWDGFDPSMARPIRCVAVFGFIAASLTGVFLFSECKLQSASFLFGGIAFSLVNPSAHAPAALVFCIVPVFASKFLPYLSTTVQGLFANYISLHAFFSVGMNNSLSSVDILAPFRLFENFNRWLAFAITFLCAYGLSIGVALRLVSCCSAVSKNVRPNALTQKHIVSSYLTARIAVSACLCIATSILRQHLFIWTVLAPRLLFEIAHCCAALVFSVVAILGASLSQRSHI
jgi:hypothetical protein